MTPRTKNILSGCALATVLVVMAALYTLYRLMDSISHHG